LQHRILALVILLALLVPSSFVAEALETETITPLADTYVDLLAVDSAHGQEDLLEVSEYELQYFSISFLMFDISQILNVPSEVKLRLFCFYVASPHVVGVRWCVNNTWTEENLTRDSSGGFFRTDLEDAVRVDSADVWYEWKVTAFVTHTMEKNYERITLTLEVENPLEGVACSRFASKDQPPEWSGYSPQLVFTYGEPEATSFDVIIMVVLGSTVAVAIVFLAYWLSKKTAPQKTRHRQVGSKSHLRRRKTRG